MERSSRERFPVLISSVQTNKVLYLGEPWYIGTSIQQRASSQRKEKGRIGSVNGVGAVRSDRTFRMRLKLGHSDVELAVWSCE